MKIAAIHANPSAAEPLHRAFASLDPALEVADFVNEEMLRIADECGTVTPRALRLFAAQVFAAADSGAAGIIVACSVYCAYIDLVKPFLDVPIVAVDAPAIAEAVSRGGKIGILATTAASAPGCQAKLETLAALRGVRLEYEYGVVTEALAALKRGDGPLHDRLIAREAARLAADGCGTLILSQITMARAKQAMGELAAITLTTPEEGAKALLREIHGKQ